MFSATVFIAVVLLVFASHFHQPGNVSTLHLIEYPPLYSVVVSLLLAETALC